MKHAYLIIAHHEFDILQKLITALDDSRNAIYVHLDKKVRELPHLHTKAADLHVLTDRVDIRWGDVSQIRAEYQLFRAAYQQGQSYSYYHLISGVHMPLYSQDYIHRFFEQMQGKQVLSPMETTTFQSDLKMNRYNFFTRTFASRNKMIARVSQLLWHAAHKLQRALGLRRFNRTDYGYASNWLSITTTAVTYLLAHEKAILKKYRYSFCGDEYFVATELHQSGKPWEVVYEKRLLLHELGQANAKTYTLDDAAQLGESRCLFARKFGAAHMDVVDYINKTLTCRT